MENLEGQLLKQNYEFKYIELDGKPQNKMSCFVNNFLIFIDEVSLNQCLMGLGWSRGSVACYSQIGACYLVRVACCSVLSLHPHFKQFNGCNESTQQHATARNGTQQHATSTKQHATSQGFHATCPLIHPMSIRHSVIQKYYINFSKIIAKQSTWLLLSFFSSKHYRSLFCSILFQQQVFHVAGSMANVCFKI